ncbi:MAG: glycoside hydrolase family 36 protein, partial [Candidatus Hodarchaeota archaeon]
KATAIRMDAVSWSNVPAGWCSWYFYYTLPDETEMIENAQFLKERFGKTIEWIQLDDGYQKSVGDWEENERFGSGLKSLVAKIKELGYKAGLWLAPFVAAEHSELFKEHQQWFVADSEGKPMVVDQNPLWMGNFYALDLTQKEVLSFLRSTFNRFKEDGFDYFKIDFLYHAALEGRRENQEMTRAQAIRKGLEVIRETVGDSFILGCGAPLGQCIGITNGMRIGTDIAPAWQYEWGGGVYQCAINTLTRTFMHNHWWKNDPDCVLVRQDDTDLSLEETQLWITVVALSGGMLLLSDRMEEVSEERLDLLDKILPIYSKSGIALDALVESEPRLFALPVETPSGQWSVVATINLSERPIDVEFSFEKVGLEDNSPHHVFEFWSRNYEGLFEESFMAQALKPHTCRLFVVKPESITPSVLSTSMHFTQGAVELKDHAWINETGNLEVTVCRSARKDESIFIVFDSSWKPLSATLDGQDVGFEHIAPEVIELKRQFKSGQILSVKFAQ